MDCLSYRVSYPFMEILGQHIDAELLNATAVGNVLYGALIPTAKANQAELSLQGRSICNPLN